MDPLLGAAIVALLLGVASLVADALPGRWRFLPPALLGVALAATFMELVRYDHGHGRMLFWVGHVAAPAFVVASLGFRAWRRRRGRRAPLRHLNRATQIAFFIVLGVWGGVSLRIRDIEESEMRGEELERAWLTRSPPENAWIRHHTKLGWLAPPRYWYGRDADGELFLAFPKGGGEWHVKARGKSGWTTVDHDPTVAARRPGPAR